MCYERHPESMRTVPRVCPAGRVAVSAAEVEIDSITSCGICGCSPLFCSKSIPAVAANVFYSARRKGQPKNRSSPLVEIPVEGLDCQKVPIVNHNQYVFKKFIKCIAKNTDAPVRWSEIPSDGLDCQKYHAPVRWSEIPVDRLSCQKNTTAQSVGRKFRPADWTAKKYQRF